MNFLSVFMSIFAVIGGIDYILGNRWGLGKEFEKAFYLLGNMALSMIGMIVLSPFIGDVLSPVFDLFYDILRIDSSVVPAMLLANDMGGAPLAVAVAQSEELGMFNGLVVSSMMGCTLSFTIPVVLEFTDTSLHKHILLGILCGMATIPLGCLVSGMMCGITWIHLVRNILPLLFFSVLIGYGVLKKTEMIIGILGGFGKWIKIVIVVGLLLGLVELLTGQKVIENIGTFEEGAEVCMNAAAVMSGAFPFIALVSRMLSRPLKFLANKLEINETSACGFIATLATNINTFELMKMMDPKGLVLNAAFMVSAGFTFAGHLAFTMSYNSAYVLYVIVGKLVAGIASVGLALIVYKRVKI